MKKLLLVVLVAIVASINTKAQVAIKPVGAGSTPDASAMLDVQSTNKGFLMPRLTTAQRNAINTPAIGLLVFDTDSSAMMLRTVAGWVKLQSTSDAAWVKNGNNVYNGNSGNVGVGVANPASKFSLVDSNTAGNLINTFEKRPGMDIKYHMPYDGSFFFNPIEGAAISVATTTGHYLNQAIGVKINSSHKGISSQGSNMGGEFISNRGTAGYFNSDSGRALIVGKGNVGIGVANPASKFSLVDSNTASNLINTFEKRPGMDIKYHMPYDGSFFFNPIEGAAISVATTTGHYLNQTIGVKINSSHKGISSQGSNMGGEFISNRGTAGYFNSDSGRALIVNKGNIGFGVTDPSQKLEVSGAIKFADTATTDAATDGTIRYNTTQGFQGKHNNNWQSLSGGVSTNYVSGAGITIAGSTINANHTTAIWNANKLQGNTVSTTTPTSGQVLTFDGTNWAPTTNNAQWTTNGANIYNNNAGNVGIGLTNPQAKLDVDGVIKIGSLTGGFNPANGIIAFDGTDFMGFNNGWKSLTTGTTYSAGSGINITGNTISTTPQTLSLNGNDLTLSGSGGTVTLPSGGNSAWGLSGNTIYSNNGGGSILIGTNTISSNAKLHIEDAAAYAKTAQVLNRGSYSTGLYAADSSLSGGVKGAQGALGNPSQPGNAAIQAFSKFGDALYGHTQNGRGLYMYGGNSTYPAAQIEHNAGSTGVAIKTLGGIDVTGYLRLNDGTQQAGRVLTTDANGYASWQAATGGSAYSAGTGIAISGNTISTNLTGGNGINISGNTISSSLQAGSGISISGNTISATGATGAGGWSQSGTSVSLSTSTDYVGIGTAGNAGAKLRVAGGSDAGISVSANGTNNNAIFASSGGSGNITANILGSVGAKGLNVVTTDATAAEFFSQNAAAISVNPSSSNSKIAIVVPFDNSGFGTTNPTDRVHIVGNATLRYQDGNEAAGKVLTSDANGRASWQVPASAGATAWSVDAGNNIYNSNTTNSTVGIGLSTAINTAYQLHTRSIKSGGAIALFQSNQSNANISLANSTGITGSVFTNGTDFGLNTNTLSGTALNLSLNVGGLSGLMIDGTTRNVSLGGAIANESLTMSGGLRLGNSSGTNAGTLRYNGSDLQGYVGGSWKSLTGTGLWSLNNNNAIFDNNRVGIGTTTPTEKLEVNGAIKIGSTFTNNAGTIRFGGFGNIFEGYDGTSWKSLQSKWGLTASNNIYSSASQNVGIGVQDGQQKLEVDGAVKMGTTTVNTSGTVRFENGDFEGFDGSEWKTLTGKDYFLKNATSIYLYDANKNVGLGTAFPTQQLELTGALKLGIANATPTAGTMQYNGGLLVHNGSDWVSLNPQFNLDGSNNLSNTTATNFGLGTATPVEKLEVSGGVKIGYSANTNAGTLRFTGTDFEGYNGTDWKSLMPRFETNGTNLWNTTHSNFGLGTNNPLAKLHIESAGSYFAPQALLKQTGDAAAYLNFSNDVSSNVWSASGYGNSVDSISNFNIQYNNTNLFSVLGNGNATLAGNLTQLSDRRLKRNILPMNNVLSKLNKLGAYTYNWIDEKKDASTQIGFIAQEVQEQFPQLVKTDARGTLSVAYGNMVPVLLQAIKEQQQQIDVLQSSKNENGQLKETIKDLQQQINNQKAETNKKLEQLEKMMQQLLDEKNAKPVITKN